MGLYDRDYTQADYRPHHRGMPQMRFAFPKITPVVKWLLIINIAIYFIESVFLKPGEFGLTIFDHLFAVFPATWLTSLQLWRLVTYQFLHGSVWHLFFNMLALYFLGPTLERHWASKKFLVFYLSCGVAGGLFFTLLVAIGFLSPGPMIGASGAILGLLAACAILFPQFVVFIMLFPVPIRVAAIGFTLLYIINLLSKGENAGGDAAHLAGMAAGAFYVVSKSWRRKMMLKMQSSKWQKKAKAQQDLQRELDRILEKVHQSGIHSLTSKEKKILRKATEQKKMRNRL